MRKQTRTKSTLLLAAGLATTMAAGGCANRPYSSPEEQAQNACHAFGPKALSGALIGAAGGAAAGAGLGALAGRGRGAALGAGIGALTGLIGGLAVGSNLDARDCGQAQQALARIRYTPLGQPVSWQSPSGSYGSYTPVSTEYAGPNGQFCRRLNEETSITGHQSTSGTVVTCRMADGDYVSVRPSNT